MVGIRGIGLVLGPIYCILLGVELNTVVRLFNSCKINEHGANVRLICICGKMFASFVLPFAFGWFGLIVIAIADLLSVLYIVRVSRIIKSEF